MKSKAGLWLSEVALCAAVLSLAALSAADAAPRPKIDYDRLAPGFVAETRTSWGFPSGSGFAGENRWGQYTAYLMMTDAKGRCTWRLEHNLPVTGTGTSQGSTMYLLEGSRRALLIDTANPAAETEGVNDLKTVVRHLLGHDGAGKAKKAPLDFVVANTHSHGDHTGENARMSDRTVYYMDGDWPTSNAPANYVPIREGGGPTRNGSGQAVGEIDLGGRVLKAIAVPPHTAGSTAYLDADNQLLFSGDALGSSWPYLQRGPLTQFIETTRHVLEVTKDCPDLVLMPAHFYQLGALDKAGKPRAAQVLDRRYVADLGAAAAGVISGAIEGEPFFAGPPSYWAKSGSAHIVYSLDTMGRPGEALPGAYRVAVLPGTLPRNWSTVAVAQPLNKILDMTTSTHVIRGSRGESLFLVTGSRRALLIGAGAGEPGLAALVDRLRGGLPLDVALLDGDPAQVGGLSQLAPANVYAPPGVGPAGARTLDNGARIDLGLDSSGEPLRLEVQALAIPGKPSMTLFSVADRVLFTGTALGGLSAPLPVAEPLAFQEALNDWMVRMGGRSRIVLAAPSPLWFNDPAYFEQLQQVLARVNTGRGPGALSPGGAATQVKVTAELPAAAAAAIVVTQTPGHP